MDCRRSLFVALGLVAGGFGCIPSSGLPAVSNNEPAVVTVKEEPNKPTKQLKPSTCVALGSVAEEAAADSKSSPADQERHLDQARRLYQQALQKDPNNLAALAALARLYCKTGDQARAVSTYTRALKAYPKEAALWYELGMLHARAKQWEAAVASLRHAVEMDPEQRVYVHALGFTLARAGRLDESFAAFAKLEGEASALFNLARMLHHMQKDELSKEHLQRALALKPDFAQARQLLDSLENPRSHEVAADPSQGSELPLGANSSTDSMKPPAE